MEKVQKSANRLKIIVTLFLILEFEDSHYRLGISLCLYS